MVQDGTRWYKMVEMVQDGHVSEAGEVGEVDEVGKVGKVDEVDEICEVGEVDDVGEVALIKNNRNLFYLILDDILHPVHNLLQTRGPTTRGVSIVCKMHGVDET